MVAQAIWVVAEEKALIEYLYDNRSEAGDNGSFRKATFVAAASHIAPLHKRGAVKTAKACQNKYSAMRKICRTINAIKRVSGWTWSDETGASITPDTLSSWEDYVAQHPEASQFKTKGWPYLHYLEALMPTVVLGLNVFHPLAPPSSAVPTSPAASTAASVDNDTADDAAVDDAASAIGFDFQWEATQPLPSTPSSTTSTPSPSPPPPPSTPTPSHATSSTRPRASRGAEAMSEVAASVDKFGKAIVEALASPSPAPDVAPSSVRLANAIATTMRLEFTWLSPASLGALVDIFTNNISYADAYMAVADVETVRHAWVSQRLGFPLFD